MMLMRVSINVTDFSWRTEIPKALPAVVRAAEDVGIDTVWVPDHLLQADPTAPPGDRDMLEAYTTLVFIAARTERVRLGAMVSAVTFRPPALLVKAITTLDVLTQGRMWLGIGAGYQSRRGPRDGTRHATGDRALRTAGGDSAARGPHVGGRRDSVRRHALPARASGRCPAARATT